MKGTYHGHFWRTLQTQLQQSHRQAQAGTKGNLAHQMRYSVELLEATLHSNGTPHVLQLKLEGGDERNPSFWTLYADGVRVAHGTGEFAQECFFKKAHEFLDTCQDAINFISLPCWSERDYRLLCAVRKIATLSRR